MILFGSALGVLLAGVQAGAPSFDPAGLVESLTHPDHVEREASFTAVVATARENEQLFAWLCARASDPAPTELAWTCRLAVRELERTSLPNNALAFGRSIPVGAEGLGSITVLLAPAEDLPQALPNLPPGLSGGVWMANVELEEPRARSAEDAAEPTASGANVSVVVREARDGRWVSSVFEAETFEELLTAHPELNQRIAAVGNMQRQLESLLSAGRAEQRPPPLDPRRLGVFVGPAREGDGLDVHGVVPGGLAQLLGIARGDRLLALNGRELRANEDVSGALVDRADDEPVRADWRTRDGVVLTATWQP